MGVGRDGDVPDRAREGRSSAGPRSILHLKDDVSDFVEESRIRSIVRRYSSFVPHPIRVGDQVINDQKPIWVEPKSQVTEEQYTQFYQHLTHHSNESPLWHLHLSADSPIQFRAILYCPPSNIELLGFGRLEHGVSLCAKRILVQSDCRELLPDYLRFLHGIVDSEDLPLNVSRETLQDNTVIRRIRNTLVKGVLDKLNQMADQSAGGFEEFYRQFGGILQRRDRQRPGQPRANRQAAPLRFVALRRSPADLARRIRQAGRAGPEADLLPGRPRPGVDQEEPEPGDLPPRAESRSSS